MTFHGHHDFALVGLSIAIAVFASYSALDLAGRIRAAIGSMRLVWLASGALAMGGGIWSMHFVAMLAHRLPFPINYDLASTLASLAAAVIVTGVGLFIVNREQPPRLRNLIAAGTFMGLGVSAMHYTGMAAMRIPAQIVYDPTLVSLSVVIAIVASIVALWLTARARTIGTRIASGVIMGAAIAGMHYTGMAAASYVPNGELGGIMPAGMSPELLAMAIASATFVILAFGLGSSIVDQRLALEMANKAAILEHSEERFRSIIDGALDAIIIMDEHGFVNGWNPQAEAIFGWSKTEAIGRPVEELIVPPRLRNTDRGGAKQFLRTVEGRGHRIETTTVHRDGREFPVEVAVSSLRDGNRLLFSAFIRDITQRQVAERELRKAKERAEAASRAKSSFLANVSHELRTPLNAIIGFSEMMVAGTFGRLGNERYQGYARDIRNSGSHLLHVINDILDLSRAEANRLPLVDGDVDIAAAIAEALNTVRISAEEGGIRLESTCPDNLPTLRADEVRIQQILLNLLSNAVKFTPRGGEVTVTADIVPGGKMVLAVTDTGIGMSTAQVAIALTPFGQVDSGLSRKYEGTGLGLPLSKSLAELHGGALEISSKVDAGTTVRVSFPAERVIPRGSAARLALVQLLATARR